MQKKCPRCNRLSANLVNCIHCRADMNKREKSMNTDICSCGQRAKEILGVTLHQEESEYLCFDCFHRRKYQLEHLPFDESVAREGANIYDRALKEFYLKPLYYGDMPNIELLDIAADINIGRATQENYKKLEILYPDIVKHG